jgi:Septum formation
VRYLQIGIIGVIIVAAIGAFVFRDQLSGSASDLKVGDCFEVPAGDVITDVQHRPCTDPHDGEVFVVADYTGPDATYPTQDSFDAWAATACIDNAFAAYVGDSFDARQDIDIGYFFPQEDGWNSGDRGMICYLTPISGGTVSVSYRKSGS